MQLTIPFIDLDEAPCNEDHSADAYMNEFEQGNFSHVLRQNRYSAQELAHVLLMSPTACEEVKIMILERMGRNIDFIIEEMNEEYKRYVRKHNDEVRSILKRNFEKDEWWPESTASLRFRKYNDYYWKSFGGKSFNNTSVCDSNHEWHEKYLLRSKRHMQYCVSQVLSSTVSDKASIIEDYAYTNFPVDNFFEAVCDMDIGEDDQKYVLRSILESCVDWELIALANASWISDNRIDFIVEWISETDTIEDEDKAFILKQIQ